MNSVYSYPSPSLIYYLPTLETSPLLQKSLYCIHVFLFYDRTICVTMGCKLSTEANGLTIGYTTEDNDCPSPRIYLDSSSAVWGKNPWPDHCRSMIGYWQDCSFRSSAENHSCCKILFSIAVLYSEEPLPQSIGSFIPSIPFSAVFPE